MYDEPANPKKNLMPAESPLPSGTPYYSFAGSNRAAGSINGFLSMGGFTKLDRGIIDSSIWNEPAETRVVWFTFLAKCDENGFVAASRSGIFRACNVSESGFDAAMKCLESPDADSRNPDNDGRRIEHVDGGWIILNYNIYHEHENTKREQTRERVRRYREKKKSDVTQGNALHGVTSISISPSISESISESDKKDITKNDSKKKRKPRAKIKFTPPTPKEFLEYCQQNGYSGIAERAYKYYTNANPPWTDSNGKPIRSWKSKLQAVWFKPEQKDKNKSISNIDGLYQ